MRPLLVAVLLTGVFAADVQAAHRPPEASQAFASAQDRQRAVEFDRNRFQQPTAARTMSTTGPRPRPYPSPRPAPNPNPEEPSPSPSPSPAPNEPSPNPYPEAPFPPVETPFGASRGGRFACHSAACQSAHLPGRVTAPSTAQPWRGQPQGARHAMERDTNAGRESGSQRHRRDRQ